MRFSLLFQSWKSWNLVDLMIGAYHGSKVSSLRLVSMVMLRFTNAFCINPEFPLLLLAGRTQSLVGSRTTCGLLCSGDGNYNMMQSNLGSNIKPRKCLPFNTGPHNRVTAMI